MSSLRYSSLLKAPLRGLERSQSDQRKQGVSKYSKVEKVPLDPLDREIRILSLEKKVEYWAKIWTKKLKGKVSYQDFISAGWVGAIKAVDTCDTSKASLSTFAEFKIRGSILDYLREIDPLSQEHRRELRSAGTNLEWQSLDKTKGLLVPKIPCPSIGYDVNKLLKNPKLTEKERRAIELRYFNEAEGPEIAKKLKVCNSRARQLVLEGIQKLRNIVSENHA